MEYYSAIKENEILTFANNMYGLGGGEVQDQRALGTYSQYEWQHCDLN